MKIGGNNSTNVKVLEQKLLEATKLDLRIGHNGITPQLISERLEQHIRSAVWSTRSYFFDRIDAGMELDRERILGSRKRTPDCLRISGSSSLSLWWCWCAVLLLLVTCDVTAIAGLEPRVNLTLVELSSDSTQGSPFRMDTYDVPRCGFNTRK